MLKICPIILALCLIPGSPDNSQNYAGIIYLSLLIIPTSTLGTRFSDWLRELDAKVTNEISHCLYNVIAWLAVVFGINSTSNAGVIARGEAECYLLHYKCY